MRLISSGELLDVESVAGHLLYRAAGTVTFDLRWQSACRIAVDAAAFHPTTLTYWRRRLADTKKPQRIVEAVRSRVVAGCDRSTVRAERRRRSVARSQRTVALRGALRAIVEEKLRRRWSPQQIDGWLKVSYPDDPEMQVSASLHRQDELLRIRELPPRSGHPVAGRGHSRSRGRAAA